VKRNDRRRVSGLPSVETALVSVFPEDPSLRMPPLSAHRSHSQPREEYDTHLGDFFVRRERVYIRVGGSDRTDPAVRSSRRKEEFGEVDEDERKNCKKR